MPEEIEWTVFLVPREQGELLMETLELDAVSRAFAPALRKKLRSALVKVMEFDATQGQVDVLQKLLLP